VLLLPGWHGKQETEGIMVF